MCVFCVKPDPSKWFVLWDRVGGIAINLSIFDVLDEVKLVPLFVSRTLLLVEPQCLKRRTKGGTLRRGMILKVPSR
jgi:hypothetical protein